MVDHTTLPFRDDVVALFPGQGSINAGAGAAWQSSRHWGLVDRVGEIASVNVERLLLVADTDEVVRTDNAQLATFALSLVGYHELLDLGVRPRYLLGHSLGEFSALVASGLLDLSEGTKLIAVRGAAMARAAQASEGSMVAVMGGDDEARENLSSVSEVWIANINGTGQIVVSGTRAGLDDLLSRHRDLGWRRATSLEVGGAFHSPLMAPAQDELDAELDATTWGETDAIVISNVDARIHRAPAEWRELMRRQFTSPMEFLDATLALPESVRTSVEMPPSGVLTGLTKRIREFDVQFAPAGLDQLQESQHMSRHVIVTGASRGIGAAIARHFIAQGDNVVSLSRSGMAPSGTAKSFEVDVANSEQVNEAIKAAVAQFGPVGVAVVNAGITHDGIAMRMSDEQWRECISTNLDGAFYTARAAMASMVRARSGSIIFIGSISPFMGIPGQANYAAAKSGLVGLARSLAREVASRSITVNVVAPGLVDTDMTSELGARDAMLSPHPTRARRPARGYRWRCRVSRQ